MPIYKKYDFHTDYILLPGHIRLGKKVRMNIAAASFVL
jgi:hypothetical protein